MPKTINDSFEDLVESKKLGTDVLRSRVDSIKKYISNQFVEKPEFKFIGSYRMETSIKQEDHKYDIDVALIFDLSDQELIEKKKKLYSILRKYRDNIKLDPSIRWRTFAIAIDFASSKSDKNYHFDFTVYNEKDLVVKGKQDEDNFLEESGTFDFIGKIEDLAKDQKRKFNNLTILLKHWNKNGKNNSQGQFPSIIFSNDVYEFVKEDWTGSNNYAQTLKEVVSKTLSKGYDSWMFSEEPFDNPFDRKTTTQNKELFDKLQKLFDALDLASKETDSSKIHSILVEYFPGLKMPDDDKTKEEVNVSRGTANKGA